MFLRLGNIVTRYWPLLLVGWCAVFLALSEPASSFWGAPTWDEVVEDGNFRYLPERADSRKAEKLFRKAFSNDLYGSSIVIVVRRESNETGLLEKDKDFIRNVLKPRLLSIQADPAEESDIGSSDTQGIIARIKTFEDPAIGELLLSDDNKATLVVLELTTEYKEKRNESVLTEIESLIGRDGKLRNATNPQEQIPHGLDLAISGSATFGRDIRQAALESARNTEVWTIILVAVLLLLIYRSPVLMFVPMLTVALSVHIALKFLVLLADADLLQLFQTAKVYVTIIMYGAGVDYCMFLMARYKEELDGGATFDEAIANAVGKVGAALTASALTVMCGIGMMVFAEFGKFQQAGICMSLSLVFVLCSSLTFTPSLLRLMGRWAYWPRMRSERISASSGWVSPTSLMARLMELNWMRGVWKKIGQSLQEKPGIIWLVSVGLMVPFAVIGVLCYHNLSYGLISELPNDKPSVIGTAAIQAHFPAGTTGPVTILIESPNVDFGVKPENGSERLEQAEKKSSDRRSNPQFVTVQNPQDMGEDSSVKKSTGETASAGFEGIRKLTEFLKQHQKELNIADIRSVVNPLGITPAAQRAIANEKKKIAELDKALSEEKNPLKKIKLMTERKLYLNNKSDRTEKHYVSDKPGFRGHIARMDVIFHDDPFSQHSMDRLDDLQKTIQDELKNVLPPAQLYFLGTTPSIRDLKSITGSDQVRINILVLAGVFLILVILLRKPAISAYLIVSVFFSYLVTLGVTFAVFYLMDPSGFTGLDWKVPMFLFTILIAVGEDYNIFLMTRIEEEQEQHGLTEGITVALQKTGGIISSCGLIMAGTFSSLLSGSLDGMIQLGFALAFGVLLDTFVVRPILVPAYLILLHQGRFGTLGKFLGAEDQQFTRRSAQPKQTTTHSENA